MHRDTDGARLIGDGAGDGLANPPGGVGGELVAAAVLELVDRLHQADVALLDQVQELQAAVRVLLGDGDDEAQVGLDQLGLGALCRALAFVKLLVGRAELLDRLAHLLFDLEDVRARSSQRWNCTCRASRLTPCFFSSFFSRAGLSWISWIHLGI